MTRVVEHFSGTVIEEIAVCLVFVLGETPTDEWHYNPGLRKHIVSGGKGQIKVDCQDQKPFANEGTHCK